jgi:hypothetical protein
MIVEIPVRAIPAYSFQTVLNGQACSLRLLWRNGKLFCDLMVDNAYVWQGQIVHDRTPLKNFRVTRFSGNFILVDYEGADDPHYSGLGSRHRMFYITDDVALPEDFQIRGTEV